MPGYVIHIAIAQQYLKKHKLNYSKEFIRGSIMPDLTRDKSKSHYGKSPAYTNLKSFLLENDLNSDMEKGKFLHLITDYLFYNHYLEVFSKPEIYDDYDISNKILIEKYDVQLIDEVKDTVKFKSGNLKILSYSLLFKMIDEVSKLDLGKVKNEVMNNNNKWSNYKNIV